MPASPLSIEQRRDLLQREINARVKKGWIVQTQTDTAAQLIKPKKFSWLWFILLLGIIYLVYYIVLKRDEKLYLTVDEQGKVKAQR